MRRIVIYESNTGFTEQYAKWIAEALQCESKSLKQVSEKELSNYDSVIFGGWILGNMIQGLEKAEKMTSSIQAVFAVGSSPSSNTVISAIREQNKLTDMQLFYLEGGMRLERLGFIYKTMLKMVGKVITKKKEKTPQEEFMEQALSGSFDHSNKAQIEPIIKFLSK